MAGKKKAPILSSPSAFQATGESVLWLSCDSPDEGSWFAWPELPKYDPKSGFMMKGDGSRCVECGGPTDDDCWCESCDRYNSEDAQNMWLFELDHDAQIRARFGDAVLAFLNSVKLQAPIVVQMHAVYRVGNVGRVIQPPPEFVPL